MTDEFERPSRKKRTNEVDVNIGRRLRVRRKELNLTQEQLANELGISSQQLAKYEFGEDRVGAARLFDLATILRVSVGWFFDDEGSAPEHGSLTRQSDALLAMQKRELLGAFDAIKDARRRRELIVAAKKLADPSG